ncbi:MAG: thioredoxin family protein [Calditrichia bacterium]|nr:thioredoxin family protein [Calditrichia bacterium]
MKAYIAEKAKADKILDYSAFLNKMSRKIEDERHGKKVDVKIDKIKLNYQRYRRINKTYQVSTELQKLIRNIHLSQYWYVITEDWCGDSGQILPYLDKIVEINPEIKLKLLLREENPEIMNHYMTDGKRAIPKLISVDNQGRELFL